IFFSLPEAQISEKPAVAPPESPAETTAPGTRTPQKSASAPTATPADDDRDRLETAARDGNAKAQHDLAIRLAKGDGGDPDYEAAARWFTAAALQGLPNAQYNLGVLYEKGLGVQKDDREAWVWYRNAAEEGHGQAQYNLGVAHARGRGMPRDDAEAVRWFRRAAEQGIAEAHYNLALLLEKGRGVERDPDAARRHYVEAAAGGVEDARDRITDLRAARTGDSAPAATTIGRAEITEIQTLLAALDFDPGPADGNFGARSREAARLFQQFAGLPETGEPSRAMLEELRAVSGLAPR
ncbi:MAG: SEL1-like repeat protein, partial [Alphaproteobacteria bacterium]